MPGLLTRMKGAAREWGPLLGLGLGAGQLGWTVLYVGVAHVQVHSADKNTQCLAVAEGQRSTPSLVALRAQGRKGHDHPWLPLQLNFFFFFF